jgi:UDP-2,4-diacetamido-2,4,6-trideoxy-beta-L-altropyranose hydrolase
MKRTVIIRADGGTSIGMGHVVRSLALADMIRDDFDIIFAIRQPNDAILKMIHTVTETVIHLPETNNYETDAANFCHYLNESNIVVLDGYHFQTEYQQEIKKRGCKLVVIDDLHAWHHVADVIINHAEGVEHSLYSKENFTKIYSGFDYILLRKEFLKQKTVVRKLQSVKKILISMGAADINNRTSLFTESLSELTGIEEIHLLLSTINPHLSQIQHLSGNLSGPGLRIVSHFNIQAIQLKELLQICDVIICPASSISLESCAIGIGLISGYTAENQKNNILSLERLNAAINLGDLNSLRKDEIKQSLGHIFQNIDLLNSLIAHQSILIDGSSPINNLNIFKSICNEKQC